MTRTTPPRPLDIEELFPKPADHRGVNTRLHPRTGSPDTSASSIGGPLLWPADEPWPMCTEPHRRGRGYRIADIRRRRQLLARAWARDVAPGPTDEERVLLKELERKHRVPDLADTDPVPLIGLVQLYRRDVPGLPAGPDGCDLLQVLWCPFEAHGPSGHGLALHVAWRRSEQVGEPLRAAPEPLLVGFEGALPEPCVLHPEQVATHPHPATLPARLQSEIDAWEERQERQADEGPDAHVLTYRHDLSIPPGYRVGGFPSWHSTDPHATSCAACGTPMALLLTLDSREWDGGCTSWMPAEDHRLPAHLRDPRPAKLAFGRYGLLNVFTCPTSPEHPHRWSIQ
ncbi:hypothetical protein LN042_36165 [Kitasatospora sp. RB6PN24]|uniref:hypothetical protein n=1 Tax=Kitasatospora humi TaxID=2893891 RepID=UPI001E45151A|nr:hypothetical protein [Kitasatospora humi]MCC9312428.1 hypothetical protein [Kitasatospora humi]